MQKFLIIILAFLFLVTGCDNKKESSTSHSTSKIKVKEQNSTTVTKNKPTKEIIFNLETIDGKKFHLKEIDNGLDIQEIKNKVTFLIFFGHSCPPCLREIPKLIQISKKYKDLSILAIEIQGLNKTKLIDFAKRKGINYNLITLSNGMNFVSYIQAKANWSGAIPFLLGFNKKGKVVIIHVGGLLKEQLEQAYNELIKE